MNTPPSEYFCPEGTIYDPSNKTCNFSLADIATYQQQIVTNNSSKGATSLIDPFAMSDNNGQPKPLMQGKYSFDSNPATPPWIQMPDGGFPFAANGNISTPAITGGPPYTWSDIIGPGAVQLNGSTYQFQVPNGNDGVIDNITLYYNGGGFQQGSGQLIFRLLVNGQAVRNFDNILVTLGSGIFPGKISGIRIYSNDSVQLQVTNVSLGGGGTQITGILGGWFYPNKLSS